jgi:hypothetical protein
MRTLPVADTGHPNDKHEPVKRLMPRPLPSDVGFSPSDTES